MPICSARRSESNDAFWKSGKGIVLIWLTATGLGAAMSIGEGGAEGEEGVGMGAGGAVTSSSSSTSSRIGSPESYSAYLMSRHLGEDRRGTESRMREGEGMSVTEDGEEGSRRGRGGTYWMEARASHRR